MIGTHPRIYISHAWGGESETIVHEVVRVFDQAGLPVIYDKKDLGYRQSIREFMVNLGEADILILVISNKYLHSEYCMFELLQIYDNNRSLDHIFPIVLDEVNIAKSTERLELVKYWEQETKHLEQKIRELESITYIEGISEDLNLYQSIRNRIARLTSILKDINTLNIRLHRDRDYTDLLAAVRRKLEAVPTTEPPIPSDEGTSGPAPFAGATTSKKRRFPWLWLLVGAAAVLAWAGSHWWTPVGLPTASAPREGILGQEEDAGPGSGDLTEGPTETPVLVNRDERQTGLVRSEAPVRRPVEPLKDSPGVTISDPKQGALGPAETLFPTQAQLQEKADGMTENGVETTDPPPVTAKPAPRILDLDVPRQMIRAVLAASVSSDHNRVGDEVALTSLDGVRVGTCQVIRPGAALRGEITRAESSLTNVRGALAFRIREIRTEDGQWLALSYPEYSDARRGEVVFPKGTEMANIVLKETRLSWTVNQ